MSNENEKMMVDSAELKARFHEELRVLRYDLGGSLADMVEDCLAADIKAVDGKRGI